MIITKRQLQYIIKEELTGVLRELSPAQRASRTAVARNDVAKAERYAAGKENWSDAQKHAFVASIENPAMKNTYMQALKDRNYANRYMNPPTDWKGSKEEWLQGQGTGQSKGGPPITGTGRSEVPTIMAPPPTTTTSTTTAPPKQKPKPKVWTKTGTGKLEKK